MSAVISRNSGFLKIYENRFVLQASEPVQNWKNQLIAEHAEPAEHCAVWCDKPTRSK